MNKITYHKYCRHHKAVKQVKRELVKLMKDFQDIESSCHISLTGVAQEDLFELKYMINNYYNKLNSKLNKEVKVFSNDAEYSTEFYWKTINLITGIEDIIGIVHEGYPINIQEYTFTFSNPEASVEEKKLEYERHFRINPLIGFAKEYFAYRGEEKRQLWPLTSLPEDLRGVEKIIIQYQ